MCADDKPLLVVVDTPELAANFCTKFSHGVAERGPVPAGGFDRVLMLTSQNPPTPETDAWMDETIRPHAGYVCYLAGLATMSLDYLWPGVE